MKPANDKEQVDVILKDVNDSPTEINQKLLEHQRKDAEEKLKKIVEIKKTKGKTCAIFNTLNSIRGKKKSGPEMVAMKHPETGNMIFDPEALKDASLNYCVKLLQNDNVDPEFKDEIELENI